MIPLFRPVCGDEEIEAVTRVLRSGWWGQGPETEKFEAEFAAYTGSRFAVAVSSATAALELAARATGLTGGIVVVPALTFISSAQAMQHAGNQVVFADIHETDLCIDWADAYEKMCEFPGGSAGEGNWGIVPVWYGGAGTGISIPKPIHDAFTIIEDCAHAAGSKFTGRRGDARAWSFHAVKNLATGDGGMVTTDDEDVAAEVRRLRWCGIDKSTWDRDKDSRVGYGWDYCLAPDTLILRSDLRHVPAEEIKEGDRLVAFDEHRENANAYRRMRTATTESVKRVRKPSITVRTSDGGVTTCSADHLWLVRAPKQPNRGLRVSWVQAQDLQPGDALLSIGTWQAATSGVAGYLAGLYDGEGSLETRGGGHHADALSFSQLPGLVMDAFLQGMQELGLPGAYRQPHGTSPAAHVQTTSIRNMMRVLGTLQPVRFQPRFESIYEGRSISGSLTSPVFIEGVEDAGVRELISIQTSTRTLVANGYLSHNCINSDGFKAHMNDIAAALGRVQLRKLDERNSMRRAQAAIYNCDLSGLGWLKTPKVDGNSATHMYVVRVPADRRPDFIRHMIANGVSAGVHYKPLNHYKSLFPDTGWPNETPVTERVWQTLVTLPLFPSMTQPEQEQVIAAVRSFRA
jgi:dTDP-4-amino-4,6-dideoxygalactose transaminase